MPNKNPFEKASTTYDHYSEIQTQAFNTLTSTKNIQTITPTTILDIGCATGKNTQALATLFPNATITAIDKSSTMIQYAATNHAHPNITYIHQDCTAYTPPHTFDLIISNATLQWVQDLPTQLQHIHNWLSQNGILLASTFGPNTYQELAYCLNKLTPQETIPAQKFPSPDTLKNYLSKTYQNIEIQQKDHINTFPTLKKLLETLKKTGTQGEKSSKNTVWTKKRISELEKIYKNRYNDIKTTSQLIWIKANK